MLFLLNDQIIEIDAPENHLAQRWKTLGCGEPNALRARDALEFVKAVIDQHRREGLRPDKGLAADLASLIIAKTGANAALFSPSDAGKFETRLTTFPELVLEKLRARSKGQQDLDVAEIWPIAA